MKWKGVKFRKEREPQDGNEFLNFTYSSSIHQLLIDYTNQGYSARPTCASHSAAFPRRGAKGPPPRWRTCAWRARGHRPKKETLKDAPWTPHSRRMGKVFVGYLKNVDNFNKKCNHSTNIFTFNLHDSINRGKWTIQILPQFRKHRM